MPVLQYAPGALPARQVLEDEDAVDDRAIRRVNVLKGERGGVECREARVAVDVRDELGPLGARAIRAPVASQAGRRGGGGSYG